MTNEIEITVRGWVAQHPRLIEGARRVPMLSMRVGSTPRRYDSAQGSWTDGPTEWFSVIAFRDLAENAVRSFRKGDPVLVRGRLRLSRSEREGGGEYVSNEIVADALGPELSHGTALYARTVRRDRGDPQDVPGPGVVPPTTAGDAHLDAAERGADGRAHGGAPETGQVHAADHGDAWAVAEEPAEVPDAESDAVHGDVASQAVRLETAGER